MPSDCTHMNFTATIIVGRLTKSEGGPVTSYLAEVRVACADCGLPFEFRGLPVGLSTDGAAVSVDALEARLAITPQGIKPSPADIIAYRLRGLQS